MSGAAVGPGHCELHTPETEKWQAPSFPDSSPWQAVPPLCTLQTSLQTGRARERERKIGGEREGDEEG